MSRTAPAARWEVFFQALSEEPNVQRACKLAGAYSTDAYKRRKESPEFAERWAQALGESVDRLEASVFERAKGFAKPLTFQGRVTYRLDLMAIDPNTGTYYTPDKAPLMRDEEGQPIPETVQEASDHLAHVLLKAHKPDLYRETTNLNVTGKVDIALAIAQARGRSGGN